MESYFSTVENHVSWNHANWRPEANKMCIYSNTVIFYKSKLNVKDNK